MKIDLRPIDDRDEQTTRHAGLHAQEEWDKADAAIVAATASPNLWARVLVFPSKTLIADELDPGDSRPSQSKGLQRYLDQACVWRYFGGRKNRGKAHVHR